MPKASYQTFTDSNTKVITGYEGGGNKRVETEKTVNIMGSSAGAGSSEFHLYLNSRKRELARMESIETSLQEEEEKKVFMEKMERNRREAEERTSKNAAKRMKLKEKKKQRKQRFKETKSQNEGEGEDSGSDEDSEEDTDKPTTGSEEKKSST